MQYRLGIDLGTSYFKVGIYDQHLTLKGLGRVAVETESGDGSLCQVPAERFIRFLQTGIRQACDQAGISPDRINAVGYSSQANSFILLDQTHNPLTPLVLWPDRRAGSLYAPVEQLWSDKAFQVTTGIGIAPPPTLCINKLLWFKNEQPTLWNNVRHVMTISDYLTFLLTGQRVGDIGTASLLGLLDAKSSRYWEKAFTLLGLDPALFPERVGVGRQLGTIHSNGNALFGLRAGTPLYAGSLDHHMAALGAGLKNNVDMSISIGTVLACVNITEQYSPQKNVCVSPWRNGQFCQLTFDGNGAVSLEWYQKNFAPEYSLEALNKLAADAGSSDGLIAKPHAFKYVRLDDAFEKSKPNHTHGNFVYALMESTADTLKTLTEKLFPSHKPRRAVATGGGTKSKLWLEICSEKLGIDIAGSDCPEPATKGALITV